MRAFGNGITPSVSCGQFTATLGGVSGTVTGPMYYTVLEYPSVNNTLHGTGQLVTLSLRGAQLIGTSVSNQLLVTGLPAILNGTDVNAGNALIGSCWLFDNSQNVLGSCGVGGSQIQFYLPDTTAIGNRLEPLATAFTASGSKGLSGSWSIQYPL